MKKFVVLLFAICLGGFFAASLHAQAPAAQDDGVPLLTADELDDLLGPIALYPDSLIALILPASTVPSDIQQAAAYVNTGGDPTQIPNQPWDDSVKALTRYPDVLNWLTQNIDWTTQLGQAFVNQPADVMDSIQQLRAKAKAEGNLVNTPQQEVGVDDGDITIDPADPNSIYVPQYDPDLVYDSPYSDYGYPLIGFGPAYGVGPWLNYGFDWRRRGIYTGYWNHRGHGNWAAAGNARVWQPNSNRVYAARQARPAGVTSAAIVRPKPLPGATIPHGNRAALQTGHLQTGHLTTIQPPAPSRVVYGEYGRGSVARDESLRGQASRQSTGQVVSRPVVAPQVVRPPVQTFSRPVEPVRVPEPAVRSFQPAPRPPPAAFQGMSSGAAAGGFSARGAQSRGR